MKVFEIVKNINEGKKGKDIFIDENVDEPISKNYLPFIINRAFSYHLDSVLFANEMNKYSGILSPKMQYHFYKNTLPPRKRYSSWASSPKIKEIELIQKKYGYSRVKAEEVLTLFPSSEIEKLEKLYKSGTKKSR